MMARGIPNELDNDMSQLIAILWNLICGKLLVYILKNFISAELYDQFREVF